MAASLQSHFGESTEITPGSSGQFDVFINDALVFSKAKTGRFPVEGEVEAVFEARREGKEPPAAPAAASSGGVVQRLMNKLRS